MTKKLIFSAFLLAVVPISSFAQPEILNAEQEVIRSSVTIVLVSIASHTMTRVDTPQMAGSFVAEIQNNDTTDDACCAFDSAASTSTASANSKSCRWVYHGGGTWVVSRWFQNLVIYCQTFNTSGAKKIHVTQGK